MGFSLLVLLILVASRLPQFYHGFLLFCDFNNLGDKQNNTDTQLITTRASGYSVDMSNICTYYLRKLEKKIIVNYMIQINKEFVLIGHLNFPCLE